MLQLTRIIEQLFCHNSHHIAAKLTLTVTDFRDERKNAVDVDENDNGMTERNHADGRHVVWKQGVDLAKNIAALQLGKHGVVA